MQTSNHSGGISAGSESGNAGLNGRSAFAARNGPTHPIPDNFIFEQVDPTRLDGDDDSDCELSPTPAHFSQDQGQGQSTTSPGLKPGKKTKGRVKIKMEFIENKLRRYTTFSKRKTGIMKKAYELSTLTGTQVMLLVASETGHVYTFATRKLQPMITSDSGKALIQTCLNSPDPPPGSTGHSSLEQRMNPSGFEETELTYSVGEEDTKVMEAMSANKPMFQIPAVTPQSTMDTQAAATTNQTASGSPTVRSTQHPNNSTVTPITTFTSQPVTMAAHSVAAVSSSESGGSKVTGIPLQLPGLILQTGNQPLTIPAGQLSVSTSSSQPQTIYRTSSGHLVTSVTNQSQTSAATAETTSVATPSTLSFLSGSGATAVTPGQIIMYQTPQGVVYAAPTPSAALGDRTIFNFQQPAHAISIPQPESGGQQIITIPVPVSLASTPQVLQLATASTGEAAEVPVQAPPNKKSRK